MKLKFSTRDSFQRPVACLADSAIYTFGSPPFAKKIKISQKLPRVPWQSLIFCEEMKMKWQYQTENRLSTKERHFEILLCIELKSSTRSDAAE
jgi:hypothetical protein